MRDVELYNGDCLELMSSINDGSVDMILCDLPYGMLNKTNSLAKWDSQIDREYYNIAENRLGLEVMV